MALDIFQWQYDNNIIYKNFVDSLRINPGNVRTIETIPFLPISFFKTHDVTNTSFTPEIIFESSGTTGENTSRHLVKNLALYNQSFRKTFHHFYGNPAQWCILGLLPGYLERNNSSLVKMVDKLISESGNSKSGFYLNEHEKLYQTIARNELMQQPTLLIGVTYAILDFVEKYPIKLNHTIIMETGGMKGRREELTRHEVHRLIMEKTGVETVHSEYGMTELLSQAYSKGNGIFNTPSWMKVLVRESNDPFAITAQPGAKNHCNGLINIVDLANLYSCAFIATDDVGKIYKNGSFEVLGRHDISDARGCSLLTANH